MEKYFSSKKNFKFYDAGQEIEISRTGFKKVYGIKNNTFNTCKHRLFFSMVVFVGVFCLLAFRVVGLSVSNRFDVSEKESSKNTHLAYYKPIKRTDILDRNGIVLATSLPTVNLYANPKKIMDSKEAAKKLARVFPDILYEDLLDNLNKNTKFVYIKRNLSPAQQYEINAMGIPGLDFEEVEKRVYPHKHLFSHVLGSTNIDNNGIEGLERFLNDRLKASDIALRLSIDSGVQETIRRHLLKGMQEFKAIGATAILMDVNTSEIISLVSLPDYDPNNIGGSSNKNRFNFAISGVYEPGSVFKIFNTALGLDSGKIKVADSFDATKPIKLKYNIIKDYRPENRWLSLAEVLIHSSNIGSAHIALKVGQEKQEKFLRSLGFLKSINIESYEKATPITPRRWPEETVATLSYGYGISVTPIHLITAFSAMMNGGVYRDPSFIKKQGAEEGHRVISQDTSKKMRALLRKVVVEGSAKRANVEGYEVAGKTGTAVKLVDGKYKNGVVITSFLSAFPASNPQYALLVVLNEPQATEDTWGFVTSGWNTVPTANNIIKEVAPQLNIQANEELLEDSAKRIIEVGFQKK